ncbi:sensor histidine kinase [Azospirillum picis]|uniref:histidine kinase n=1 Tax=Azospirillum picis TaxID=488438 RepID=A0ABU0MK26_9PROT|nr:histidine kinase dimerization/phosphoacceptor domain -containing protein [Azospirillum picis]MBP2299948.1 two-component sensor histidine kinase [Azospirillum picis]MDQ0533814.1 two-component sensor histidine kinase [Azospirillum picis]
MPTDGIPSFHNPRLEAAIGWLAACGFLFLAVVTVVVGVQSRERAVTGAQERAQAAVRVLAEHAARLFDAADLLVEYAAQESAGRPWDEIAGSRELWDKLNAQRARLPFLDAVWLNDPSGLLRLTTVAFPTPYSDASDREAFLFHRKVTEGDRPHISQRIIGRVTNQPTFLLSRRLSEPGGSFRGMVSVTVDPSYLAGFYKTLDLPHEPVTILVRADDLSVLVREPVADPANPTPLSEFARQALRAPQGDGVVRDDAVIIAHRRVDSWPAHVVVQLDLAPVLATWRRLIAPYAGLAAAAALALMALSLFAFRQAQSARVVQLELERRVLERTASLERTIGERDAALAQKDLLMREVNHRIKNSLQVVSSLLGLQGQAVGDARLHGHLQEAGRRVQAIADIHRLLYRVDDVQFIPFHDYLTDLCRELERSAQSEGGGWRLDLAVEPLEVPTDHAVQLGLIANELVMNAIKHAYRPLVATPAAAGGARVATAEAASRNTIAVGLHADGGMLVLSVADRGVGLPSGFDWRQSRSLGMRLIHTLSDQLDATLSVENTAPGARFTIRLPREAMA